LVTSLCAERFQNVDGLVNPNLQLANSLGIAASPARSKRPQAHLLVGNVHENFNLPTLQVLEDHLKITLSPHIELKRPSSSNFIRNAKHCSIAIMPIRNPFKRGPGGLEPTEAIVPELADSGSTGFQKTNVVGAKPIDIKEPLEYKLSGKRKCISERLRSI